MGTVAESRAILYHLQPTQEKVNEAIALAVEVMQPSRVFVFGSWARGDVRWDSDLDMAILLPDSDTRNIRELQGELHRQLDSIPMSIDLLIATESYAERMTDPVNGLFHDIFAEGQLVYDSQQTASGHVTTVAVGIQTLSRSIFLKSTYSLPTQHGKYWTLFDPATATLYAAHQLCALGGHQNS